MEWYRKISKPGGMYTHLPGCMSYFEKELEDARSELSLKGKKVETVSRMLPGLVEYRFAQLQEVEAILEFLNIELNRTKSDIFKKYRIKQNRDLSTRDAEKFSEGDPDYVNMAVIVNEFAIIRNRYLGVTKGLEFASWQIGHIVKLRTSGLDDATLI